MCAKKKKTPRVAALDQNCRERTVKIIFTLPRQKIMLQIITSMCRFFGFRSAADNSEGSSSSKMVPSLQLLDNTSDAKERNHQPFCTPKNSASSLSTSANELQRQIQKTHQYLDDKITNQKKFSEEDIRLLPQMDEMITQLQKLQKDLTEKLERRWPNADSDSKLLLAKHFEGSLGALWVALKLFKDPAVAMAIVKDPRANMKWNESSRFRFYGETPLELAARAGRADVVGALVADGASISENVQNKAIQSGSGPTVETILKYVKLSSKKKKASNFVNEAVKWGNASVIEVLVKNGWSVAGNHSDAPPLYVAAGFGSLDAVRALVRLGANMDAKYKSSYYSDRIKGTALHAAAENGHTEVVEYLLDQGADREALNGDDETPLHLAATTCIKCVKVLVARGANIIARDKYQRTPLHHAAKASRSTIVEYLLDQGADKEARDHCQGTPLHKATNWESGFTCIDCVKTLIARGANINALDNWHRSALHHATFAGRAEIFEFLISNGANIQATDKSGDTSLAVAKKQSRNPNFTKKEADKARYLAIIEALSKAEAALEAPMDKQTKIKNKIR